MHYSICVGRTTGVIYGSCLTNSQTGYLVGILGRGATLANEPTPFRPAFVSANLLRTTDGGRTWTVVQAFNSGNFSEQIQLRGVACPRLGRLTVVGSLGGRQALWTSFDNGATFGAPQIFSTNLLFAVSQSNTGLGFAVGKRVYLTLMHN